MSNDVIISVENLGKKYRIRHQAERQRYTALRDVIAEKAKGVFRKLKFGKQKAEINTAEGQTKFPLSKFPISTLPASHEDFWALKDVSFSVRQGEVIGIIGRNGAGKSTLLKILSRITEPTEGRVKVRGRIASLLEVGTGFHPELTGRENVFLNGAILGMSRAEVRKKFDEIVAFAEVEKFLDMPVKRYSSGMYVRLAFAVAAHLEPEILIVDEVLAVGDAQFQKKCLGKMGEVAKGGRTVLFVSHNMTAVRNLCRRVLWLEGGSIRKDGPHEDVTSQYLNAIDIGESPMAMKTLIGALPPDPAFRLIDAEVLQDNVPKCTILNGQSAFVRFVYEVLQPTTGLRVYFDICDENQDILIRSFHDEEGNGVPSILPGCYESIAEIPPNLLAPREYVLVLRATVHNVRSCMGNGIHIRLYVLASSKSNRAYPHEPCRSKLQPVIGWQTTNVRSYVSKTNFFAHKYLVC